MIAKDAKIGLNVKSSVNEIYKGTYEITKVNNQTCSVKTLDNTYYDENDEPYIEEPFSYDDVSYSILIAVLTRTT